MFSVFRVVLCGFSRYEGFSFFIKRWVISFIGYYWVVFIDGF